MVRHALRHAGVLEVAPGRDGKRAPQVSHRTDVAGLEPGAREQATDEGDVRGWVRSISRATQASRQRARRSRSANGRTATCSAGSLPTITRTPPRGTARSAGHARSTTRTAAPARGRCGTQSSRSCGLLQQRAHRVRYEFLGVSGGCRHDRTESPATSTIPPTAYATAGTPAAIASSRMLPKAFAARRRHHDWTASSAALDLACTARIRSPPSRCRDGGRRAAVRAVAAAGRRRTPGRRLRRPPSRSTNTGRSSQPFSSLIRPTYRQIRRPAGDRAGHGTQRRRRRPRAARSRPRRSRRE